MLELLIAVGAGVGGDLLAIDAQREIHVVEKARDGIRRDRDIDLLEKFCDRLGRLAGPLQTGDGISGGIVLQQNLDGIDYFGRFFSARLRPPPVCAPERSLRPGPRAVVVHGLRCACPGQESRPVDDRRHGPI